MRMTDHDVAVATYDRILRLLATISVTLTPDQINTIENWLKEEAVRVDLDEDNMSVALRMMSNIVRLFHDQA